MRASARAAALLLLAAHTSAVPGNMGVDHVGFTVPNVAAASQFLLDVFDCELDWEVKRDATPTSGERGWDKLFGVHSDSYMPHVAMLRCGDHHLAQYLELFEWVSPDQQHLKPWTPFSDIGHGYFAFTVKDIKKTMDAIKDTRYFKEGEVRFIKDPPMEFPLRGEVCTSTFLVSPWGQWIELSEWSVSAPKGTVMKRSAEAAAADEAAASCAAGNGGAACDGGAAGNADAVRLEDVLTPAWFVDLDIVDHNIRLFTSRLNGVLWRPPVKAHKSPAFAKKLLAAGATGILALKVSEAEVFAANGIKDIYVANCVVQPAMVTRLVRLAGRIDRVSVHVDNADNVRQIAETADQAGLTVDVLVEVNIGHNRTGVDSTEHAVELALLIQSIQKDTGAIRFAGIAGYEGHTPVMKPEAKKAETKRGHGLLRNARDHISEALDLNQQAMLVSGGGSSNYVDALNAGVLTEIEAGGFAMTDKLYNASAGLGAHGHKIGCFVETTVVSVSRDGMRAMADAGFKAVGWHPFAGLPVVVSDAGWEVAGLSAEHLKLKPVDPANPRPLKVGTRLTLVPGYTDAMGLNHKVFYGVRKGVVEETFPVLASGMMQ
eukprot:Rhum_TRINITY_DN21350_c0_g1::Rhum_TRINITY_DN21350_c0_g1_i1::g.173846::m.173846